MLERGSFAYNAVRAAGPVWTLRWPREWDRIPPAALLAVTPGLRPCPLTGALKLKLLSLPLG